MRILTSLLNRTPAPIAARFRGRGRAAQVLRGIVQRGIAADEIVAVVRSGQGRGIKLVLDPQAEKYYWAGQHDVEVQRALMNALRAGAVFWDVGAHIGFFTVLASRAVGPAGQVHAFEPMPSNRRRLADAVQLNNANNVTVHPFAVTDSDRSALLHAHTASAMWTLVAERGQEAGVEVACRTIDSLASTLRAPNVIKIDVEGAELEALRGGLSAIEAHRPTIVVEFAESRSVDAASKLLPGYRFDHLAGLDWLLTPLPAT